MIDVGIIGASGFTGAELLRLCAGHPELEVVFATGDSQAGTALAELYPSLAAAYPDLVFDRYEPALLDRVDLVFCGLPARRLAGARCPSCATRSKWVVDLAADFRLQDPALYPHWYGEAHAAPELLAGFAYGLPELFRAEIAGATRRRHARLLPDGRRPGPGAARSQRAWSRPPASSSTPPAACRAPVGRPSPTPRSARSTRTSPPTACSPTGTRPRWSRPSPGSPASTPTR